MNEYIVTIVAGLLAGAAGAMGLGGGSILLMYLTLMAGIPQLSAQGINLIFFIPCALSALFMHQKRGRVPWDIVIPMICWGLPFALAGFMLGDRLGGRGMGKIFGIFLLLLGIRELFAINWRPRAMSNNC